MTCIWTVFQKKRRQLAHDVYLWHTLAVIHYQVNLEVELRTERTLDLYCIREGALPRVVSPFITARACSISMALENLTYDQRTTYSRNTTWSDSGITQ